MDLLKLEDVCKTYVHENIAVPVLKNINLNIEKGSYTAVMGPSGSGKSTLMNIIGCLDRPTTGIYTIYSKVVSSMSERELSKLRLSTFGFVFQNFNLLSHETALENVCLPLFYAGIPQKERRIRAAEALSMVGLSDRLDYRPNQLSGGQCQRVAIARAIVNSPELVLADEPTGALDTSSGEQIMELFNDLSKNGITIIMITHERSIAEHAEKILHILDGCLSDEEAYDEKA
jgi:putative ABC transport system ATP-binding protein